MKRDDDARIYDLLRDVHADVGTWSRVMQAAAPLRRYQLAPARAIADSIVAGRGDEFCLVFARQSGKDELLAQLIAWLLARYRRAGGRVVVGVPAVDPQGRVAIARLTERLRTPLTRGAEPRGYEVALERASVRYLSASQLANPRGQTASLALIANEAQDIDPDIWDARFAPMAASTNATRVYSGTIWTRSGLLWRQIELLRQLEARDGRPRVWFVPWRTVAEENPAYGRYVEGEIAKLGASHPFIRTEYELQPIDGTGGLFPPDRQAQLRGDFPPLLAPRPIEQVGVVYAATLDVAGEEEEHIEGQPVRAHNRRRDSSVLTIWRVIPGASREQTRYEAVQRYEWVGLAQTALHDRVLGLLRDTWRAVHVVVDCTGVGAGVASFLARSLGDRSVTQFRFTLASKSQLGWDFVGMIDAGRVKVYDDDSDITRRFWRQASETTFALLPGPGKLMRWSVPDPNVHDDLIVSAALVAALDRADLRPRIARGRPW